MNPLKSRGGIPLYHSGDKPLDPTTLRQSKRETPWSSEMNMGFGVENGCCNANAGNGTAEAMQRGHIVPYLNQLGWFLNQGATSWLAFVSFQKGGRWPYVSIKPRMRCST